MPSLASISDPKAYHILSYGTFFGTTIFQSFIGSVIAFRTLPRAQFGQLQQATVPVFFTMQTVLPLIMALTYPGERMAQMAGEYVSKNTGISGVFAESNRWTVLAPLATIFVTSAINMLVLGPATTKAMKDRHHQGMLTQVDSMIQVADG